MAYSREVRLGIVLYGGVSLAIYENGVSQELFHAVHGDGVYALLKDIVDSDIVVDVISGTSAGGVNGIYLAYALANGKNFTQMSKLWLDKGDIQKLLRQPADPATSSVLDSAYYQAELENAFRNMDAYAAPPDNRPSTMHEIDLFVTGTDVGGDISTVYDEEGHAVDVKKHNSVFQLSWRGTRKNEFNVNYAGELATLARLTSCFPAAFEPVGINVAQSPNLARWGRLRATASGASPVSGGTETFDKVFLDGGILNNKPFSYTIDAISRRTANRPVQRFLFYVEPDPERFRAGAKVAPPTLVSAALKALIDIPDYQSIGNDLSSINGLNQQVRLITELIAALGSKKYTADCLDKIAITSPDADPLYTSARLIQLRDRAVEGILNTSGERECFTDLQVRRAGRILVESFSHWKGEGAETATLENFDVYFRARRLQHLTYVIYDPSSPASKTADWTQYANVWDRLNHEIQVLEIVQWAMEWYVDHVPITWKSLSAYKDPLTPEDYEKIAREKWGLIQRGLTLVLDSGAVPLPDKEDAAARETFYTNMKAHIRELAKRVPTENDAPAGGNLLKQCDARLVAFMRERMKNAAEDRVAQALCAFFSVDTRVFPLQLASGIFSRDQIRVERLSPIDAKYGYSGKFSIDEKLAGKTLSSFGGFFKRPWRSNDIMWGRLDALSQTVECILTQSRVRQLEARTPLTTRLGDLETRLNLLFPKVAKNDPLQLQTLATRLPGLAAPDLPEDGFKNIVDQLVLVAQNEVIAEEWPGVINSAMVQERDWSIYRAAKKEGVQPAYDSKHLVWVDPKTTPDYLIVQTAAAAIGKQYFPDFSQCKVAGRPFSEEIPGPVLLELGSRAVMRLEKSIFASAPKFARIPILHRTIFGVVVPSLYGWSTFHRSRPEWRIASSAALLALSVAIIILTIVLWTAPIGARYKLALILAPLTVIAIWLWVFRPPVKTRVRTLSGAFVALLVMCMVMALILLIYPYVNGMVGH